MTEVDVDNELVVLVAKTRHALRAGSPVPFGDTFAKMTEAEVLAAVPRLRERVAASRLALERYVTYVRDEIDALTAQKAVFERLRYEAIARMGLGTEIDPRFGESAAVQSAPAVVERAMSLLAEE